MSIKGFNISGTTYKVDYPKLDNLPQINGNTLTGDKNTADLGLKQVAGVVYGIATSAEIDTLYQAGMIVTVGVNADGALQPRTSCILIKRESATKHLFAATDKTKVVWAECNNNTWTKGVFEYATSANMPQPATQTPHNLGIAAVGAQNNKYALEDHVHAMPAAEDVGAIPNPTEKSSGQVLTYNGYSWVARTPSGGGGMTEAVKQALLDCFQHVAWIDDQGQTYYNALYNALYPPAELVSISAVFTQGDNVIYDTDTLDTLKQYLVVTAAYDDQTTQTVTDYTLSGTLAEGTSTITVSYGGKTTTFNVTVTHAESGEIEMMPIVEHTNMSHCPLYSDDGTISYSDERFPTSNGRTMRSVRVFDNDTRVKITCAPASRVFQCFLFSSSLWDGTKTLNTSDTEPPFYYCESSNNTFAYGWSNATHEFEYTVKAGYALTIIGISSSGGAMEAISVEVI